MKKVYFIILFILCIFSFNNCFNPSYSYAATEIEAQQQEQVVDKAQKDDVLEQPVFEKKVKKPTKAKKFTGKLSNIIIRVLSFGLLLLIAIICISFIWLANLQRKKAKRKKKSSTDPNVINAVDNFVRPRIKH